ncbi:hypothetical protein ABEF95_016066 [Exophiala dermatitidis]
MDPLSAIGLASNILSFIDISGRVLKDIFEVYNSATGATIENAHIAIVVGDLVEVTGYLTQEHHTDNKHSKALCDLAKKCSVLSAELLQLLGKLQHGEKRSKWRNIKVGVKSVWKRSEIASIEQRLDKYRSEFILRLIFMFNDEQSTIKTQLDTIQQDRSKVGAQRADQLGKLRDDVREALQKLSQQGQTVRDSARVADSSTATTLAEIRSSLAELLKTARDMPSETQVLRRLYFSSMYTREDSVVNASDGTFSWLVEANTESEFGEDVYELDDVSLKRRDPSPPPDPETTELGGWSPGQHTRVLQSNNPSAGKDGHSGRGSELSAPTTARSSYSGLSTASSNNVNEAAFWEGWEIWQRNQSRSFFLTWLQSGHGVFHISGKAGSGKSTMMKFLSHHDRVRDKLRAWADGKKLVFCQFFFWKSGDKVQMSLEGLYRSLLFEVLKQCPELIPQVFPDPLRGSGTFTGFDGPSLRFPELEAAFNALIETHSFPEHRFCFFIDGLDEYEGDSPQHWELAQKIQRWASSTDVKFCVSSRPHTEFMQTFSGDASHRIRLHELTRSDIHRFATDKFEQDTNFEWIRDIYAELVREIVSAADGVFLWARLVARSLLEGAGLQYSHKALRERMATTPKDLEKLFEQLLGSVNPADRKESDKLLLLAGCGYPISNTLFCLWLEDLDRPGFPFDLPFQAYCDTEIRKHHETARRRLQGLSKGLLEVVPSRTYGQPYFAYSVQFFHRSVPDYLAQNRILDKIQSRIPSFNPVEDHFRLRLAQFKFVRATPRYDPDTCLLAANFDYLHELTSILRDLGRAADRGQISQSTVILIVAELNNVLESYKRSQREEVVVETGMLVLPRTSTWMWCCQGKGQPWLQVSYLQLVAIYGPVFNPYVKARIQTNGSRVQHFSRFNLLFPAMHRNPELARFLLEAGANPNDSADVLSFKLSPPTVVSMWMVYLARLVSCTLYGSFDPDFYFLDPFLVLEQCLTHGADKDVFFLLSRSERPLQDGDEGALFSLTLQQFVDFVEPPNREAIQALLRRNENQSLWGRTMRALSVLPSPKTSSADPGIYEPVETESLRCQCYYVERVCLKGTRVDASPYLFDFCRDRRAFSAFASIARHLNKPMAERQSGICS